MLIVTRDYEAIASMTQSDENTKNNLATNPDDIRETEAERDM